MIKILPWDSEFFGLRIGQLELPACKRNIDTEYDLIYVLLPSDKPLSLEGSELTFTEEKLVFSKKPEVWVCDRIKVVSHTQIPYNVEELYALAYESGKYSRFRLDSNFPTWAFSKLYRQWVDNSLNSEFATDVLLAVHEGKICGMVTYKINGSVASIGLIAVSAECQGRGIGSDLLYEVESRLQTSGVDCLDIPTQASNLQACAFYRNKGYEISKKSIIQHYWRKK